MVLTELVARLGAAGIPARVAGDGTVEVWPDPPHGRLTVRGTDYHVETTAGSFVCPIEDILILIRGLVALRDRGGRRLRGPAY